MGAPHEAPKKDGGSVSHQSLEVKDVVPGCGSSWNDGNGWELDLQIAQHELFNGELVIICPLSDHRQPYLLVGPLGRKGGGGIRNLLI